MEFKKWVYSQFESQINTLKMMIKKLNFEILMFSGLNILETKKQVRRRKVIFYQCSQKCLSVPYNDGLSQSNLPQSIRIILFF